MSKKLVSILAATVALAASPSFAAHLDAYQGSWEIDGASEVPPVDETGRGHCSAILDGLSLHLSCTSDLEEIVAAHIHRGFVDESGPVEIPLVHGRVINETVVLTEEQAALAIQGGLYVNVHTALFPGGALRGQVALDAVEGSNSISDRGGAALTVPEAAGSDATASCRVFYEGGTAPSARFVCNHSITDPTAAHVHLGGPGEAGDIVFPFADPTSPIIESFDLSADQLDTLESDGYYVNVHSADFPSGEARVDIGGCISNNETLCLLDDRFSVTVSGTDPRDDSPFVGQATPLSGDSGSFAFFRSGNKEVLVKVLDGCSSASQAFWVFFSATTNVAFDLDVTDTATGLEKRYSNTQGTPAEPVQDIAAFATCP